MIPIFEDLPFLGQKWEFTEKENTAPPRKLASSVLIAPKDTSNVTPLLILSFPLYLTGTFLYVYL